MDNIKIFNNEEFGEIRTVEMNGEPWLVASEIAKILGYSNPQKAVRDHIDEDDKLTERIVLSGQNREVTIINESGLYSLILSSKLPNAKKFKHWVTSEVLPAIRKHGAYMNNETLEKALTSPDFLIQLAEKLKDEQEKRIALEAQAEKNRPKVAFADAVCTSKQAILVGELAKILKQNGLNIGQNRLFKWLRTNGYLISRQGSDRNTPTQKAMELGLFEIKETVIAHSDGHSTISKTTKVTGKGQVYFINRLLKGTEVISV